MKLGLLLVCALAACGSKSNPDTTPPGGGSSGDMGDPVSSSDPQAALGCEKEIAAVCGDGAVDGCLAGTTTVHICVAADAQPSGPCSQEVMLTCAEGQYDACTTNAAPNHVCVFDVPKE